MFDQYLLIDGSAHGTNSGGRPGLSVQIRIAYYRGLWLSMIEELELAIDGRPVGHRQMSFTVHGNTYQVDQLEHVLHDRWGYTEVATLQVQLDEPLSVGEHTLVLTEKLRISYLPAPAVSRCSKVMWVTESPGTATSPVLLGGHP